MNSPRASTVRARFGSFEIDLRAGELRKHGLRIRLQVQPLQILGMLLERPGEVVTREELRQALWPGDTFVDFDHGLNNAINRLRETLSDSAESQRFIETLPRRGYRFIAAVENIPSPLPDDLAVQVADSSTAPTTPLSDKVSALSAESSKASLLIGARLWIAAGVAAVALLALLVSLITGGLRQRLLGASAATRIQSIAVLPLENFSGDPSKEYFADGMTEALITELGKIGELRVISRTSAMHYKGTRKTLPEIARELNVEAVIEGSVLRSGDRVRITAQLVQAASERHLWAESYERDVRDSAALQDEVARAVANEVKTKLSPQEQTRLASAHQVNPEAYDAYLKGRYESHKQTEESLKKSIEYFEQAIEKDPAYAQAWAGLSDAYDTLTHTPNTTGWTTLTALPKAKHAALKALELDDALAEAHETLGGVLLDLEWSWSAAEKEFQRAIALDPNSASAHEKYGADLLAVGRLDEAIGEIKRALRIDPVPPDAHFVLGMAFDAARRYDEALQEYRETAARGARGWIPHRRMAGIYEQKGMQKEALDELLVALRVRGEKELAALVEQKYLSSGYIEAKKTYLQGDVRAATNFGPVWVAADYAALGEKNKAFEWLDKSFQMHAPGLTFVKVDHRLEFEALRSDSRFQDLLRRMGLPQ